MKRRTFLKRQSVKGRGARQKGSRAEIKLRNMLRTIYPTELHDKIYRVPLSGGGAIKCDVYDGNDPDSAYEVKAQETLCLPDWWRQTTRQSGATRTPILVITQSYRPFYFILRKTDWVEMLSHTEFVNFNEEIVFLNAKNFMDRMAELEPRTRASITLDEDECVVISQSFYLEVKTSIYESNKVK